MQLDGVLYTTVPAVCNNRHRRREHTPTVVLMPFWISAFAQQNTRVPPSAASRRFARQSDGYPVMRCVKACVNSIITNRCCPIIYL